jgi:hypothetical protein
LTTVSPDELAEALAGPVLGPDGRPRVPLLVVDLDGALSADPAGAARAAAGSDTVLVGISRGRPAEALAGLVAALDLTLVPAGAGPAAPDLVPVPDPPASAARLTAVGEEFPQATTVLAALLRWSGALDVPAALDAESLAYSTLLGGPEFAGWLARRGPRPLPPVAAEPVLIARDGDRLRLTLNRPERRNAYGRQLRDALVDALALAELDPGIERVVLDGAGPAFCSGGDLDEFGTTPDLATAHLVRTRGGAARPLHRLADRLEVHVHGACVGAGIELPAFAGRIVAASDAGFRLPEIGMGLIPGAGGTVSIPRRIGRWRALYLALTGEVLGARTALDWGLVDEVADA